MAAHPSPAPSLSTPLALAGAAAETPGPLTPHELYRLTLYKWQYALEAAGFPTDQVPRLLFLKWLHTTRRMTP